MSKELTEPEIGQVWYNKKGKYRFVIISKQQRPYRFYCVRENMKPFVPFVETFEKALADNWEKVEEAPKRWKPAEDEYYYFVSDEYVGSISKFSWQNDATDNNLYKAHNCFNTRQKAEQARDLWIAERELRSLSGGGVWGIHRKRGEFIPYNEPDHILSGYRFPTFEEAQEAIKQLGEDKLKLIFGVK